MPPKEVEQKLLSLLAEYRAFLETRLLQGSSYTWNNLVVPLEELDARLRAVWSPFNHRNAVINSDELREVYGRCVGLMSNFEVDLSQNKGLYDAYQEIAEGAEFASLLVPQKRAINNALRDFRLAGVHLRTEQKARFKEIAQKLSELQTRFEDNLTDATNVWEKHVLDETVLSGLPEEIIVNARKKAEEKGLDGYVLSMDDATALKVSSFADNSALREEFFFARNTRASDVGPSAGNWDNEPLYKEILELRYEYAQLVGFKNYAEFSLATKMVENTDKVLGFLGNLAMCAKSGVLREYEELSAFAKKRDGVKTLESWDVPYYLEEFKKEKFSFSEEEIRQYFSFSQVLEGMFTVVSRLYGVYLEERKGVELWHSDARFFEIYSQSGHLMGGVYMDFFARQKKRGGAWMDEAVMYRMLPDGSVDLPVAYLTCNFTRSTEERLSFLTLDEVETLFHEFGHVLNHVLTHSIKGMAVSGINGVEWDSVELPSQFMENFCWERESLDMFAKHFKTGEKIPDELFENMRRARTFGKSFDILRRLGGALFDFRLHLQYLPNEKEYPLNLYNDVYKNLSPLPLHKWMRFLNGFHHVFGGAYAAGYYSYLWAEVLSADAFSAFLREDGTIDWSVGRKFLNEILSREGSRPAMENFVAFRGRKPSIEPLLKQYGFVE